MKIRLGTRGSKLALTQTEWVMERLREKNSSARFEIVTIRTSGDKLKDAPLAKIGGKGLFVKEIEEALAADRIDIGVHSLKDMPAQVPAGLEIGAVPGREDPRDVLIASGNRRISELPGTARIGTGSLRRSCQLKSRMPEAQIVPLRGNLDTRIRKIDSEGLDGIIVAAAGLKRMGWLGRATEFLSPDFMIPAIGQGALALEVRADDPVAKQLASSLNDRISFMETRAERSFLSCFGGGCQLPVAAYGKIENGTLALRGMVGSVDGGTIIYQALTGRPDEGEELGCELAETLLANGGRRILNEIYSSCESGR